MRKLYSVCHNNVPKGGKGTRLKIPRSVLHGISDREDVVIFLIRSLTPQQATGIALAVAVHSGLQCLS
jgi:hypothetical protein